MALRSWAVASPLLSRGGRSLPCWAYHFWYSPGCCWHKLWFTLGKKFLLPASVLNSLLSDCVQMAWARVCYKSTAFYPTFLITQGCPGACEHLPLFVPFKLKNAGQVVLCLTSFSLVLGFISFLPSQEILFPVMMIYIYSFLGFFWSCPTPPSNMCEKAPSYLSVARMVLILPRHE